MSDVLFEITEDHLETGMRGYPVGYCPTSKVDPQKGLVYAGLPVSEIKTWPPLEAIFLLLHGHRPSSSDLEAFKREGMNRARLSADVVKSVRALPSQGDPMKLFASALLLLGVHEGAGDYREDCLNLIFKIPLLVAELINHHAGWGETPKVEPSGYMEHFVELLNVPNANKETLKEVINLFDTLHLDHGGGNLSTFVGKAVASGLQDLYGSLAAAMCGLGGPRHGKANQDCLEFVKEVHSALGDHATEEQVEQLIRDRLAAGQLVFGFGHAVLRVEDPRATAFYDLASRLFPEHPLVKIALHLRSAGSKVLSENPKIADPHPNVDAMSGTVLSAAGFPYPQYYTVFFGMSRCVGIAIQIVYERLEARGGKGTPIVRPKYFYKPRE